MRNSYLKISRDSPDTPEMVELADSSENREDHHSDTGRQCCQYHDSFLRGKPYAP